MMRKLKTFICFVLICVFGITPIAAIAREDPPGPGLFEFIFGGTIWFKQVGVTVDMSYKLPASVDPEQKWRKYDFSKTVELLPGTITCWDINVENGRKSDENIDSTVEWSNPETNSRIEVARFKGGYCRVMYTIPEKNILTNYVRIYADSGRRDQDNVAGVVLWVNPNPNIRKEVTYQTSDGGSYAPQISEDINHQTGTVSVYLYNNIDLTSPSEKSLEVTFYADSKRHPEQGFYTVNRMRVFEGFPAGKFTIYFNQTSDKWFIKLNSEETKKYKRDDKGAMVFELEPGSNVNINFYKEK